MKKNKFVVVFIFVIIASVIYADGQGYELKLCSNKEFYTGDEPIVLNVTFQNNSKKDLLIVRPQDGSENKYRYPHCYFEVKDENGVEVKDDMPACKTVNPLEKNAFRLIPSGQSCDFFEDGFNVRRSKTLRKGKYYVCLYYSTDAKNESQWYGLYADDYWRTIYENEFWKKRKSEMAEIRELLKKVPPVNLVSSTITIEIVGDGISKEQALKIAEDICKEEGWEWVDVGINENGDYWDINTQKSRLGANAFIRINKKSGEVSEKYITGP